MEAQEQQAAGGQSDAPWWFKYTGKAAGILAGCVAMLFGVWACVSISAWQIVAGIWQICAGFSMIVIEAPFCCQFLDFVNQFSNMVETRPPWQRSIFYFTLALPPILMSFPSISVLIGSGCVAAVGVLYGVQAIGKKASRSDMAAAALGSKPEDKQNIVTEESWQSNNP